MFETLITVTNRDKTMFVKGHFAFSVQQWNLHLLTIEINKKTILWPIYGSTSQK